MQSSVIITYLVEERNKNERKPLYFMVCHGCMVANIPAVVVPSRCYCCWELPEQSHRRHVWAPHHRKYIYPCTNFLNPNKLFWGSVFSIQYWTFPQWVLYPFKNRTEMCPIFLTTCKAR